MIENGVDKDLTKKKSDLKKEERKTDGSEKIKKLKKEIANLKKELAEEKDKFLRVAAEFNNYKKRSERDFINLIESANRNLFLELLPIIDDIDRSINAENAIDNYQALKDGVSLIYQKLLSVLKKQGLEPIEAIDTPFYPEYHEALMQMENKAKDSNLVLEEVLKGYKLKDKVIRHAKVIVNK